MLTTPSDIFKERGTCPQYGLTKEYQYFHSHLRTSHTKEHSVQNSKTGPTDSRSLYAAVIIPKKVGAQWYLLCIPYQKGGVMRLRFPGGTNRLNDGTVDTSMGAIDILRSRKVCERIGCEEGDIEPLIPMYSESAYNHERHFYLGSPPSQIRKHEAFIFDGSIFPPSWKGLVAALLELRDGHFTALIKSISSIEEHREGFEGALVKVVGENTAVSRRVEKLRLTADLYFAI